MTDYINLQDCQESERRVFTEFQLQAFGGKVLKVKHPNAGELMQLEQLAIKYAKENNVLTNLNGFSAVALFAYDQDEKRLFPEPKVAIEKLNKMDLQKARQLVAAVLEIVNPVMEIPEDAIVKLAKKSEADA